MENKKYRIVVTALTPKPSSQNGRSGGLVRLLEIMKRISKSNGVEIVLVAADRSYERFFEENGIAAKIISVKTKLIFKNSFDLCLKSLFIVLKSFFVLSLDFLENKNGKVVIYASSDLFWEVIPALFYKKKNRNAEWVQLIHHIYPNWKKRPGNKMTNFFGYYLQRFSFSLIRNRADKIVLVNNMVRNELMRIGFPKSKLFVSSNGIDGDYFEYMKRSDLEYDGIFLARLSPSKGITNLIEIWKNVCREIPGAKLAVIGGGLDETKTFLQKKINSYNLKNNIDLLGFLENEKAHPILKAGKVFLFPSHEEGWGIAIAEAMACGLPVVSWNLPVYKEIFEEHIFKIEEDDINYFSEKVVELLKNRNLSAEKGRNGRNYIKKYSWDRAAQRELEIIAS